MQIAGNRDCVKYRLMIVGERIAERLVTVGLSQSELARRLHVRQSTISGLIRGEQRSSTKLHQIARELGTTPAYLNGEVDDPQQEGGDPQILTGEQAEWLSLFDALDLPNRAALIQIARTMVTGMNKPTVNMPDNPLASTTKGKAMDLPPIAPADLADADLLREYQRTDGEPGDPVADALVAEIERRQLDI